MVPWLVYGGIGILLLIFIICVVFGVRAFISDVRESKDWR